MLAVVPLRVLQVRGSCGEGKLESFVESYLEGGPWSDTAKGVYCAHKVVHSFALVED